MSFNIRSLFALLVVSSISIGQVKAQDVPSDVKPDHWSYEAISDLARKNLIKGYPPDGKFLGNRTMTRYEFAVLLKRALDHLEEKMKNMKPGPVQNDNSAEINNLRTSVRNLQRLVEEFKTELTVIGTNMRQVKSDIDALRAQVGELSTKVDGFDGRINDVSKKVDEALLLADQALNNIDELKNDFNKKLAGKVDHKAGKLSAGALFQMWYAAPLNGRTLGGNFISGTNQNAGVSTAANVVVPAGRTFGGGVGQTYRLRRGEIVFAGEIVKNADFRVMFDVAKTGTANGAPLQDLWVGYKLGKNLRAEIGQQKPPLSLEGPGSSSALPLIERSIMNGLPATLGRIGDMRETGAILRYNSHVGMFSIGYWNDNGARQSQLDDDRQKFGTAAAYFNIGRYVVLGAWGGQNISDFRPKNVRTRAGGTLKIEYGRHFFISEFGYAVDRTGNGPQTRAMGGYALYGYRMSPMWQFVGRFDEWDPSIHGGRVGSVNISSRNHNLKEYTFGINYNLKGNNSKIQVNYIVLDPGSGGFNFWGIRRQIVLSNFQISY